MDLSISKTQQDGATRVSVVGEVDVSNASELREQVDAVLAEGPAAVTVDLAEVAYIDSTGIGVLVGAAHHAADHNKGFAVVNAQPGVMRVVQLLGVDQDIDVRAAE